MLNIKQIVDQTKINMGYNNLGINNYTYNDSCKLPISLNNLKDIEQIFKFYDNLEYQRYNEDYFGFECAFRALIDQNSTTNENYVDYLYQLKSRIDKEFTKQVNKALSISNFKFDDLFELLGINEAEANDENLYFHLIFRLKISPKVFFRKLRIEQLLQLDIN